MASTDFKASQRLTTLTRVVRAVDSAPDLDSALRLLVHRTREVMGGVI